MKAVVRLTQATGWGLADVMAMPLDDVADWAEAIRACARKQ